MSDTTTHRLRSLKLKRVSLVDSPANEHARVVLFKSAEPKTKEQPVKKDDDAGTGDTVTCSKCQKAVSRKADGTCPNCGAKLPGAMKMDKAIDLDKIEDPGVRKAVEKMAADLEAAEALAAEEQAKRIEAEKKAKPAPAATEEDVLKGLPEAFRTRLEKAEGDAKAANDAVKKMAEDKRELEYVAKARSYTNLPVKAAEFGKVMKRVADGTSTDADLAELHRVLTAANQIAKSLFVQKGTRADAVSGDGSAWSAITAKAKELRETVQKSGEKLTQPEAIDRVCREEPGLYQQYLAENAPVAVAGVAAGEEE